MACIGDALVINKILDHLDEQVAPEPLRLLPQRGQRLPARPQADCAASDTHPPGYRLARSGRAVMRHALRKHVSAGWAPR
jgi:hypothetical protein